MRTLASMTALSALVFLIACQQPVDLDAEATAIRRTAGENAEASSRGGVEGAEGYASSATTDARWLPPQVPAIRGREAIAEYVAPFTNMPGFQVTWEHPHVVVSRAGDIAYSVGTYSGSGQDPDGNLQEFAGKLVNVWHKQPDGSWKVAVAIWNTDEPPSVSDVPSEDGAQQ